MGVGLAALVVRVATVVMDTRRSPATIATAVRGVMGVMVGLVEIQAS
jgi:hypothetical protein